MVTGSCRKQLRTYSIVAIHSIHAIPFTIHDQYAGEKQRHVVSQTTVQTSYTHPKLSDNESLTIDWAIRYTLFIAMSVLSREHVYAKFCACNYA